MLSLSHDILDVMLVKVMVNICYSLSQNSWRLSAGRCSTLDDDILYTAEIDIDISL